jgi:hypothetical protein
VSAKGDVLERRKIIDVSASLKMVWVVKQSGETFSFSGGKEVNYAFLISTLYGVTKFTFPTVFPCGEIQRYPLVKRQGGLQTIN